FIFFFQAEDGIRDLYVTGVQTCALPISQISQRSRTPQPLLAGSRLAAPCAIFSLDLTPHPLCLLGTAMGRARSGKWKLMRSFSRSEERRVGKECRFRWSWCT